MLFLDGLSGCHPPIRLPMDDCPSIGGLQYGNWDRIAKRGSVGAGQGDSTKAARTAFAYIILTTAVIPAAAEEFFFRGFVMSSLKKSVGPLLQILISGAVFGAFHVISGSVLSIEKFLPTTFLGLVLGWVAYRTGSLYPGILLHAMHNALMFSLAFYDTWLLERGWVLAKANTSLGPICW